MEEKLFILWDATRGRGRWACAWLWITALCLLKISVGKLGMMQGVLWDRDTQTAAPVAVVVMTSTVECFAAHKIPFPCKNNRFCLVLFAQLLRKYIQAFFRIMRLDWNLWSKNSRNSVLSSCSYFKIPSCYSASTKHRHSLKNLI